MEAVSGRPGFDHQVGLSKPRYVTNVAKSADMTGQSTLALVANC
jgi:hypothetical protein